MAGEWATPDSTADPGHKGRLLSGGERLLGEAVCVQAFESRN